MNDTIDIIIASDVRADELRVELWAGHSILLDVCDGRVMIFAKGVEVRLESLIDALLRAKDLDNRPTRLE